MNGILDAFKLDGKVAVVTGSERGLGRGMAIALAQAGAHIVGVTYVPSAPETEAAVQAAGRRYVHVLAGLSSIEPVQRIVGSGNLWITEYLDNKIGRISPTGTLTEFPIPTVNSEPFGITAGPDGNLWFTESFHSNIGRMTVTGAITEFPLPTANCWPEGITSGPDGNVWFTETSNGCRIRWRGKL